MTLSISCYALPRVTSTRPFRAHRERRTWGPGVHCSRLKRTPVPRRSRAQDIRACRGSEGILMHPQGKATLTFLSTRRVGEISRPAHRRPPAVSRRNFGRGGFHSPGPSRPGFVPGKNPAEKPSCCRASISFPYVLKVPQGVESDADKDGRKRLFFVRPGLLSRGPGTRTGVDRGGNGLRPQAGLPLLLANQDPFEPMEVVALGKILAHVVETALGAHPGSL